MSETSERPPGPSRRAMLATLAGLGFGSGAWRRAVAAQASSQSDVTLDMIRQAEWIADIELTDDERKTTLRAIRNNQRKTRKLRDYGLDYNVPPAVLFNPAPFQPPRSPVSRNRVKTDTAASTRPRTDVELAFLPVHKLAQLVRSRQVTSLELTRLYLSRLKQFDPLLHCVVSLTEDLAMRQAKLADREIRAGRYRGPLHGIPWGAKDLIAVPGYRTTWGATPFRDQQFDHTATIARRLDEAGAVLVAKLSLGALAMGDRWMKKMTRNPWAPSQGSSGSSAGSACAAAAGLVGFAIGTETLGSIVSPCRRCGATGLRPTFGRISRYGCMPLSWTMDKPGPITRSVEDCALVLDAVHGSDGLDPTATDQPFRWERTGDLASLRVGYIKSRTPETERDDLKLLRQLGVTLVPISLPHSLPVREIAMMLDVEASTVFEGVVRDHLDEDLGVWPTTFRAGQFVSAVDYLRAARARTELMQEMEVVMSDVHMYVGGRDLAITNLTGHPTVVMPAGFRKRGENEVPYSVTLTGRLFGEADLLQVARAWESKQGQNEKRPPLDRFLREMNKAGSEGEKNGKGDG